MLLHRKVGFVLSVSLGALVLTMFGATRAAINASSKSEDEDAKREIMEVLKAHEEYWNRHDIDTWADKILHEDSDWVNWQGGYWHGKAAIREGHRAIHKAHYKNTRLSPQRIEDLTFITPDIALAHVRSELSGDERAPGETFPYRKTILFTRQKGVWRIRALHNTRIVDKE